MKYYLWRNVDSKFDEIRWMDEVQIQRMRRWKTPCTYEVVALAPTPTPTVTDEHGYRFRRYAGKLRQRLTVTGRNGYGFRRNASKHWGIRWATVAGSIHGGRNQDCTVLAFQIWHLSVALFLCWTLRVLFLDLKTIYMVWACLVSIHGCCESSQSPGSCIVVVPLLRRSLSTSPPPSFCCNIHCIVNVCTPPSAG